MRASFRAVYGIADPGVLDWSEFHDLLWELPADSPAMLAMRQLLAEEGADGESLPPEGPQTMEQARNLWNRMRSQKAGRPEPTYRTWDALRNGPMANDPRLTDMQFVTVDSGEVNF